MLAGENVSSAAHIGGKLIDFGEGLIDHASAKRLLSQVADHEIVGFGLGELRVFEIHGSYPKPSLSSGVAPNAIR